MKLAAAFTSQDCEESGFIRLGSKFGVKLKRFSKAFFKASRPNGEKFSAPLKQTKSTWIE